MKSRIGIFTLLSCTLFSSVLLHSQSPDDAAMRNRLDQVANSFTPQNAFMGAVLVAKDNQLLLNKGYGMASLEWGIPNSPETKFRIGSVTKQFTATLILQLQEDGKLKITDPVSKYIPTAPPSWEKITIANLLGHTSGISSFTDLKEFPVWSASPHNAEDEMALVKDKPLEFAPGSQFKYSNTNFEILGLIIEKASGKKYGDLLRERIFEPAGMKESGLDSDDLVLAKRAEGYMPGPKGIIVARSESMSVPWAAGSIYTTTGDLLKWEKALFGGKVLNADSLKTMTTPGLGNYGTGVMILDHGSVKAVEHGGGIEGFNANLLHAPDQHITVVVLSNVNGMAVGQMGAQLLDVVLGRSVKLANERVEQTLPKEELKKFFGVFNLAPTFSLTVTEANDGLTVQGTGQPALSVYYEGSKDGHAHFFARMVDAQFEFVPDEKGEYTTLILHQGGHDMSAKRQ
jgi:CubicO group peptidase (beta-lactamase class C family)